MLCGDLNFGWCAEVSREWLCALQKGDEARSEGTDVHVISNVKHKYGPKLSLLSGSHLLPRSPQLDTDFAPTSCCFNAWLASEAFLVPDSDVELVLECYAGCPPQPSRCVIILKPEARSAVETVDRL